MKFLLLLAALGIGLFIFFMIAAWYVFIFAIIAVAFLAGLTFWIVYAMVLSVSASQEVAGVVGGGVTVVVVGLARYFFLRNKAN